MTPAARTALSLLLFAFLSVAAAGACRAHATPPDPSVLTPEEYRGREIYFTGRSPSGAPVAAWFGEDLIEVPGETVTCSSCHGYDGTGRPESGVIPFNVTWKYLTKSYGHVHPGGLEHPPFDEASLTVYMESGEYPGGRRGDPSMPVYQMPARDMQDLIAYMKRLGELLDPGLTDTSITIGTVLPGQGPGAPAGAAVRGILESYFGSVNQDGGIYGRRLLLAAKTLPQEPETALGEVAAWLEQQPAFALVSPYTPGLDREVQAAAAKEGLPVVGPLSLYAVEDFALRQNIFYVLPGLSEQLRGLLYHVRQAESLANPKTVLVHPDAPEAGRIAADLQWALAARDWTEVETVAYPAGPLDSSALVADLHRKGAQVILLVANGDDTRDWLEAARERGWFPRVLVPGVLAGGLVVDAPREFAGRLFFSYPTLARDRQDESLRELARLAMLQNLPTTHLQSMVSAYVSAKLLVEGLRRSGKDLSRRRLLQVLQQVSQFDTGLTAPLTYGPSRRVGAGGAWIVPFAAAGEGGDTTAGAIWVEVD